MILSVLVCAALGALAVQLGTRMARSAVIDLGPTDGAYVQGFREIERDGQDYVRWSSVPSSAISAPIRFCGPGAVRLRLRRHFADPATVTFSLGGTIVGQQGFQARTDVPYEIVEFSVSKAICSSDALVLLESSVTNGRDLGVVVDWLEITSPTGFGAAPATLLRGAAFLALSALALAAVGGGTSLVVGLNVLLATGMTFCFASTPVGGERILRGAVAAAVLTLVLGLLIALCAELDRLSRRARIVLVCATLLTLVSRSAFLDPRAFYPDYRVHALVQQTLVNRGLPGFLDQLFEIQYARSLGLQQVDGRWYPFPYPPGAYFLADGASALFGLDALDSSQATAVAAASLLPLLTVAVGLALGLGEFVSVAGAFYLALQPLLVRRMALGYFPGLMGQFLDTVALLLLIAVLRSSTFPVRRSVALTLALLAGFLVYTQSIANFGLLVTTLLVTVVFRRTVHPIATFRIAVAAAVALTLATGAFYWRYVPVMANIASHRPQPEAVVLERLDQLRQATPTSAPSELEDTNDPFAGTSLNPARGLLRLGSRLWRFNGPFALAILVGFWGLCRRADRPTQDLWLAWSGVAVWISLLAAGLPSPNGFQHLKDLEFTAPLGALAMARLTKDLWDFRPAVAIAFAAAWTTFAADAFLGEFTARLLPLAGL